MYEKSGSSAVVTRFCSSVLLGMIHGTYVHISAVTSSIWYFIALASSILFKERKLIHLFQGSAMLTDYREHLWHDKRSCNFKHSSMHIHLKYTVGRFVSQEIGNCYGLTEISQEKYHLTGPVQKPLEVFSNYK